MQSQFAKHLLAMTIIAAPGAALAQADPVALVAASLPAASLDLIAARITAYTTFQQLTPDGIVRWSPRAMELVVAIEVPSPTWAGVYLYALQYEVSVLSDRQSLVVHATTCEVTVVRKDDVFDAPTVVCDAVDVSRAAAL